LSKQGITCRFRQLICISVSTLGIRNGESANCLWNYRTWALGEWGWGTNQL